MLANAVRQEKAITYIHIGKRERKHDIYVEKPKEHVGNETKQNPPRTNK